MGVIKRARPTTSSRPQRSRANKDTRTTAKTDAQRVDAQREQQVRGNSSGEEATAEAEEGHAPVFSLLFPLRRSSGAFASSPCSTSFPQRCGAESRWSVPGV